MAYDAHANFALTLVDAAPSPATTGTSLTVAAGTGSRFPVAPFNVTIWPPNTNPTIFNAEVVRVTSRTSDTLTIVRAQEGSTAIAIRAGYSIANTITNKVFTDIQDSIIQSVVAGGSTITAPTVVFSNSNGVSFGASGSVITASVANTGGGGGAAISAGTESQSTGTVIFSNSNGVSFGLDAGTLTASVAGGNAPAASAANGSFSFNTLSFSNANGISFSTSAGSAVFASHNALTSQSAQAASASNGSFAFQTLGFSNANGITFGTSAGSIISASHNGLTSQSNQAASASNGSFAFQTLGFSNANGVTFGTSAGSIITASVGAGVGAGSISAGTTNVALGEVVFSNSNGVSFGLDGSTVTASVNAGGGNTFSLDFWENFSPPILIPNWFVSAVPNQPVFSPFFFNNGTIQLNTVNAFLQRNGANTLLMDCGIAFYSLAVSSQLSLHASTSMSLSLTATTMFSGAALQLVFTGMSTASLTQGQWVAALSFGGTNTALMNMNVMGASSFSMVRYLVGGTSTVATNAATLVYPYAGMYSASTAAFPATVGSNQVIPIGSASLRPVPYINAMANALV